MAELINIGGQTYKRRNIIAVWLGLPLVTLGVYYYVWYYKVNNEARRFLNDPAISPGISLLAVTLGWLLIVPPFISIYRTAKRVQRMQQHAGMTNTITPWIALALVFAFSLHTLYIQNELNNLWDRYRALPFAQPTSLPGAGPLPGAAPPPPPPHA